MTPRNLLVVQGGGPTQVLNATLAAIVGEAHAQGQFSRIFGARLGLKGFADGAAIDLGSLSPADLDLLRATPGAALGSSRAKPSEDDLERFLKRLRQHHIHDILFAGGTSSGKTSVLNTLATFIPPQERIIVIEESSELQLRQPHVIQLETRGPDRYGKGAIDIRELFRNSLRMRPDRIIVGETRGGEALDLIQALTSGHGGSMSTMHADTPTDALNRLETMALMSDVAIPLNALRTQISSSIDIVVIMSRFHDASRRVVQITEVLPVDAEYRYQMKDIFTLKLPEGGRKIEEGVLAWTGARTALLDEVQARVLAQDLPSLAPFFADTKSVSQP